MTDHHYRVSWEIDIYSTTPQRAARQALDIQRNPVSTATVFDILNVKTRSVAHCDLTPPSLSDESSVVRWRQFDWHKRPAVSLMLPTDNHAMAVARWCIQQSRPFQVEPYPDGEWEIIIPIDGADGAAAQLLASVLAVTGLMASLAD
jgi:hypothetical protein